MKIVRTGRCRKRGLSEIVSDKKGGSMKVLRWLNENLEESIMIAMLIIMTIVMGSQVCARYIFNYSMSWTEEFTRYVYVWSGFLSIGFAIDKKIAIRLEQLTEKMNAKLRSFVFIIDYMIEFVFFGYLLPTAVKSMQKIYMARRLSTAMEMPMWILQLAPVVGFILAEIRLLQKIYGEVQNIREGEVCK